MAMNVKVLFSAERDEKTNQVVSAIRCKGMDVTVCQKNGADILNAIEEDLPDVIIMEAFMQHIDGLGVLNRINMMSPVNRPLIIVLSTIDNLDLQKILLREGADCFFTRPIDVQMIVERIVHLVSWKVVGVVANFKAPQELEISISEILHRVGIPANVKGYRYIREAVELVVENPSMINSVTTVLYPTIARKFESTPSTVERAMRYAINLAWERGNLDILTSYFGYASKTENKPTNSEFVARIADDLRFERKTHTRLEGSYRKMKNF